MGLGLILFILAILVSLVFFIIFVVKSARDAGALHVVLICILFIESWVFVYFTAGVHAVRVAAAKDAAKEAARLKNVEAEVAKLRYGEASAPDEALEAVIPVQGKLDRITIDRGRIWRQATFIKHTQVQDKDQVQISLQAAAVAAPADPNNPTPTPAPAPAAGPGRSLPQNMVVYGFQEQVTAEGQPLPVFYLGEYKVIASDEASGTATLEATRPLQGFQQARIKQGTESWTLFELLPIDSHSAFVADQSAKTNDEVFGRPDEEKIKELLTGVPEKVLNSYLRDGKQATDVDPPESLWALMKLTKDVKRDVDSDQNADATLSGYFDQSGRAVDIRLKRGEEVNLNDSSTRDNLIVVIDSEAKRMVNEGVAEKVQPVFVRPLNDYEELFNRYAGRGFEIAERIKYYQHQSSLVKAANQDGQIMLAQCQKDKQLLDSDISNYGKEIDVLKGAVAEAIAEADKLKGELSKMYKEIQSRRQKLVSTSN